MTTTEIISPRWSGIIVVAATGPSLTKEVAELCRGHHCIAVNDAYKLFPFAEVLYACDAPWWKAHNGCPDFLGEKWSSHDNGNNEKRPTAERFGLHLVNGKRQDGFSLDPSFISYGGNSGFQATNLAIHFSHSPGGL